MVRGGGLFVGVRWVCCADLILGFGCVGVCCFRILLWCLVAAVGCLVCCLPFLCVVIWLFACWWWFVLALDFGLSIAACGFCDCTVDALA